MSDKLGDHLTSMNINLIVYYFGGQKISAIFAALFSPTTIPSLAQLRLAERICLLLTLAENVRLSMSCVLKQPV